MSEQESGIGGQFKSRNISHGAPVEALYSPPSPLGLLVSECLFQSCTNFY